MSRSFRWLACIGVLTASACAPLLPDPVAGPTLFDLGPLPAEESRPAIAAAVRLDRVRAPSWLDSTAMNYRLLHEQPAALHRYADHAWIAPPAELIRMRLEHLLTVDGSRADDRRLELELLTFEQLFHSADSAEVEIRLRARLLRRGSEGGSIERSFRVASPVSPSVRGAIEGLPAVTDEALEQVLRWLDEPG